MDIKLVILDRDGVINYDSVEYIKSPQEWLAIPGSLEAIAKLNKKGVLVVVASNQSGLARGYFDKKTLLSIHQKMSDELAKVGGHLDGIFYCPHHPKDKCHCRKPAPGLLIDIQNTFQIPWHNTVFIGDSLRDLQTANNVGCPAMLVKTGNGEKTLQQIDATKLHIFNNLSEAVEYLLGLDTILW